jgi:hypothetical protein
MVGATSPSDRNFDFLTDSKYGLDRIRSLLVVSLREIRKSSQEAQPQLPSVGLMQRNKSRLNHYQFMIILPRF